MNLPTSVYKLINEEEASGARLKQLLEEALKPQGGSQQFPKIEVRLVKQNVRSMKPSPQLGITLTAKNQGLGDLNGTRSNIDRNFM